MQKVAAMTAQWSFEAKSHKYLQILRRIVSINGRFVHRLLSAVTASGARIVAVALSRRIANERR
jgi:ribosomal protein S18